MVLTVDHLHAKIKDATRDVLTLESSTEQSIKCGFFGFMQFGDSGPISQQKFPQTSSLLGTVNTLLAYSMHTWTNYKFLITAIT